MLTPQKAADHAGVSRPSIMAAIKSGKLKASRTNKSWLIAPEDLEEWMQGRRIRMHEGSMKDDMPEHEDLHAAEVSGLKIELAQLKGQISGKDELIDQLRRDLEHARLPFWRRWIG